VTDLSRAPTSKSQRRLISACCAAHITQDGLSASIYIILPVLAQAFGFGYGQVGLVRATHSACMWLLEIPSAMLSERLGERPLLVFGLLCAGAGYLCVAAANGLSGIAVGLAIAGCGAAFQHSLCSALIARSFDSLSRRSALGAYNSSGDIGKLTFTGILSLLLGVGVYWQALVVGYAVVAIVVAVLIWHLLAKAHTAATDAVTPVAQEALGWGIKHRAGFTVLAIIVFLDIAVQDGFFVFVTFVMLDKGVSTGLAASAVVLTLIGGVLGKFALGRISMRFGIVATLIATQCLTAIGIAVLWAAPAAYVLAVLPLLGIVLQGSSTMTYGAVSELVSNERQSRGFAAIYTMANGASIVGPISFGLIGDQLGLSAALIGMGIVVLATVPLAFALGYALRQLNTQKA
jgi:MFS transporter, FSR family, fosmidomycin resistance protein